jgi:putative ABC transport system permease protein
VSARPGWGHDFLSAARTVVRSPGYSVPSVVSVLLGIGATTVIFAIFSAVVWRPLPFAREDRLVAVLDNLNAPGLEKTVISGPELVDYGRMSQSLASFAAYVQTEAAVTGLGEPRHVVLARSTSNFFQTLGVNPLMGRYFDPAAASSDTDAAAIISHGFWMAVFGGGPALGRTVIVNGTPRTVIGVFRPEQSIPAAAELWIPLKLTQDEATHRGMRFLYGIGRLKDGVSLETARREMDVVSQTLQASLGGRGRKSRAVLWPLREELLGSSTSIAQFMLAAVCVFLLLSCTNVASLLLTRASVRNHEIAVRKALGASPGRLRREGMFEALLIVAGGGGLGLLLAQVALQAVAHMYGELLAYARPQLDARVVLLFGAICLLTALAIGVAPALRASQVNPMDALRKGDRGSPGKGSRRLREVLVCAQVGASVVLLIGAGALVRSGMALTKVASGFTVDGVVFGRVSLPPNRYADEERSREFVRASLESLRAIPGVQAVAVASQLPLSDTYAARIQLDDQGASPEKLFAEERHVTPEFFRVLEIPLLNGRVFDEGDRPGNEVVAVVNRTFATKMLGGIAAVGRRFTSGGKTADGQALWYQVAGVVEDVRDFGLETPSKPLFYLPFDQAPVSEMDLVVRGVGDPGALLSQLPQRLRSIDENLPLYSLTTMRGALEASYASRTVLTGLLITFAIAAMLLASIGLFGVTSYSVSQRVPELGIRRAIGASRAKIVRMVLRETGLMVAVGVAAGMLGSWLVRSLMASLMFGVSASDGVSYAAAAAIAFVVSILAALAPARQAAAVPPISSLKLG